MSRIDEIYKSLEKYIKAFEYADEHRDIQEALRIGRVIRDLDSELAHERGLVVSHTHS